MKKLRRQIQAYEKQKGEMETEHFGKWVIFHDEKFIDSYEDFQDAAQVAIKRFGRGPYLIRRVGQKPMRMPASLLYGPANA